MKKFIQVLIISITSMTMQGQIKATKFTDKETDLITAGAANVSMRVLQTTSDLDYTFLIQKTEPIHLKDTNLKLLAERMLATVNDPKSRGLGIAAPQVGIGRKAFWVKRLDKKDNPFEFFINPKITWYSDIKRLGKEGCLSIPDQSGMVYRSLIIEMEYFDLNGKFHKEIIEGFTAVICQHEYDHLEGVLYPDQMELSEKINYQKAEEQNQLYYKF